MPAHEFGRLEAAEQRQRPVRTWGIRHGPRLCAKARGKRTRCARRCAFAATVVAFLERCGPRRGGPAREDEIQAESRRGEIPNMKRMIAAAALLLSAGAVSVAA